LLYKTENIVLYAGILGLVIFLIMSPAIDLHSGINIGESREVTEERAAGLARDLGLDDTGLRYITMRRQHERFFNRLSEELPAGPVLSPAVANRTTYPLSGWHVFLSRVTTTPGMYTSEYQFFEALGSLFLSIDDHQRVRYAIVGSRVKISATACDEPETIAERLLFDSFGYDSRFYRITDPGGGTDTTDIGPGQTGDDAGINELRITYEKVSRSVPGPARLDLVLAINGSTGNGPALCTFSEFTARYFDGDNHAVPGASGEFDLFSPILITYAFTVLVVIFVLVVGIRQIFRGRVEWRRGLLLGLLVGLAYFLWSWLYLQATYYRIFSAELVLVDNISNAVFGLIYGFIICISYIAWESVSRENNLRDVQVIDSVWGARFFHRETGRAIMSGYAVAGLMLALLAAGLFAFGAVYMHYDSAFQPLREASTLVPSLSSALNIWMVTLVAGFIGYGVVVNYIRVRIGRKWLFYALAGLFTGLMFMYLSRVVLTSAGAWPELMIFFFAGIPLLFGFLYSGLMSVLFAMWALQLTLKISPYLGSPDTEILVHGLVLLALLVIPLIHGIMAYFYGGRITDGAVYIPEYEQKLARQLRFEREFEIAKSSQHALMPKKAPGLPGLDVQGFFIPSYEVGGDFYDYSVQYNSDGEPKALAVAVADVSGKSIKAAFGAIYTSGLLLSRMSNDSPEQVLREANRLLYQKTDAVTFITCQVCRFDLHTRVMRVANTGHCPPMIRRGNDVIELDLPAPRYPLGMRPDVPYGYADVQLQPGDVFLLYSDGLPEARNRSGERLEFDGLRDLLARIDTGSLDAAGICDHIRKTILTWSDYELADDTTVVCVKIPLLKTGLTT
jgi:serine phosphatase RsbU (regulator of sigma subunit)